MTRNEDIVIAETLLAPQPRMDILRAAVQHLVFDTFLDIGAGAGGASLFCAANGKRVTAIEHDVAQYDSFPENLFQKYHINLYKGLFETFPVDDYSGQFDAIWVCHVLEHVLDVGVFFEKILSLLSEDGWLMVVVPPYDPRLVSGHVNTGWNLGQLIYVLLLGGFDVRNGHFIHHHNQISAFVRKRREPIPSLRRNRGDLETLAKFFPFDGAQHFFDGNIKSINWFDDFKAIEPNYYVIPHPQLSIESANSALQHINIRELFADNEKSQALLKWQRMRSIRGLETEEARLHETKIVSESKFFDVDYYQSQYSDDLALSPHLHYVACGVLLGHNPSKLFDSAYYLKNNYDVCSSGMNPLVHFELSGRAEGRRPRAD